MDSTFKKSRANQVALSGAISAPAGLEFFNSLRETLVFYFPTAPESLWNTVFFVLAAVLGGGLGKAIRTLEG